MSECFKAFSICLGQGFLACGNAISHMQLLTQICQVLLRRKFSLLEPEKLLEFTQCGYWAGQDTFWWAEYAEIQAQDWRHGRVWGKGWLTIKQNLCDCHQGSQVKSQVRQQLSSSLEFLTVTSLSLFAPIFCVGCWPDLLSLPSSHRGRESKVTQMERSWETPELPGEARLPNAGRAGLRTHTAVVTAKLPRLQPGSAFTHRCSSRYSGKKEWGGIFLKKTHTQILTQLPRFHEDRAVGTSRTAQGVGLPSAGWKPREKPALPCCATALQPLSLTKAAGNSKSC